MAAYDELLKFIKEGNFSDAEKLPSEPKLAEQLGISRNTLRKAISLLKEDGIIINIQGKGNFINRSDNINSISKKITHPIYKYFNDAEKIDDIEMEYHLETCTDYFSDIFGRRPSVVVIIDRWYKIENKPVAYSFSAIPIETISDINLDNNDEILEFVQNTIYNTFDNIIMEIKFASADSATKKYNNYLKAKDLFLIRENIYQHEDQMMMFSKHYLPQNNSSIKIKINNY